MLTNLDPLSGARMVDVTPREPTHRRALARCRVSMLPETTTKVANNAITKGDVLAAARIAGIQAAKRTAELIPLAHPLPLPMEPKAAALLTPEARLMLRALCEVLARTEFSPDALDAALRGFAAEHGLKLGQVAQPLRVALTGSTASPGIDVTLVALGKQEALARLAAVA